MCRHAFQFGAALAAALLILGCNAGVTDRPAVQNAPTEKKRTAPGMVAVRDPRDGLLTYRVNFATCRASGIFRTSVGLLEVRSHPILEYFFAPSDPYEVGDRIVVEGLPLFRGTGPFSLRREGKVLYRSTSQYSWIILDAPGAKSLLLIEFEDNLPLDGPVEVHVTRFTSVKGRITYQQVVLFWLDAGGKGGTFIFRADRAKTVQGMPTFSVHLARNRRVRMVGSLQWQVREGEYTYRSAGAATSKPGEGKGE